MQNLEAVVDFSNLVKVRITPYAFPHLTNDFICQLVIMAGAVFIFSNAPYEDDGYYYMLSRSGKFSWALGKIFYSIGIALLYSLFLLLVSLLPLIGNMEPGCEWGKIWGTLAKTDAGMQVGLLFQVSEYMISHYSAGFALMLSFLLEWCCAGWLPWAIRFSPITLAQINTYAGINLRYHITLNYGILFFLIGILVLGILCVSVNYKEDIGIRLQKLEVKWRQKQ